MCGDGRQRTRQNTCLLDERPVHPRNRNIYENCADTLLQTAEIIALLYEATQTPQPPSDAPALNPTGGVKGKPPLSGLSFQKDGTRPGGGVFVAKGPVLTIDKELQRLPAGTIIRGEGGSSGDEGEAPAAVSSEARSNNDPMRSSLSRPSGSRSGPGSVVSLDALAWSASSVPHSASASSAMFVGSAGVGSGGGGGGGAHLQLVQQQQGMVQGPVVNYAPLGGNFQNMNPALNDQVAAPENVQVINVLNQTQEGNTLEQHAMADVGFLEGIPGQMFDWGA